MAVVVPFPESKNRMPRQADAECIALVTGAGSGIGLALVQRMLIDETVTTIFAGCRDLKKASALRRLAAENPRLYTVELDVTDDDSIREATRSIREAGKLDLVINTAGILHEPDGMQPEKRLSDLDFDDMLLAFDVNALGTMRLALKLQSLLQASRMPKFVSLSARVGSISDNRLGGWYTYRASKAALNMLLRTLAIEWRRAMPTITCAALHPGTVATPLSAPFTSQNKPEVFSPHEAADHLLSVIDQLGPDDNGGFFAWDGSEIPW
jgi:NAD(P)-dependent dehydrogenase (short-subunit alcohol dehydrogenase family)